MGTAALVMGALILMLYSQAGMEAASRAAEVFAGSVLPALFPMMVLSRLLPPRSGWVSNCLFGFASGSPASAQRLGLLWEGGALAPDEAECLSALTGVMSPMFFTGTLARWTGDAAAGWRLLAVHWASAIVTALLWRRMTPRTQGKTAVSAPPVQPFIRRLPQAIVQSGQSALAVCGAMMLFAIVSGVLRAALGTMFPIWTARNARGLALLCGMLEIGGGAAAVVQSFEAPYALLSGLCGFGGVSIWMQNLLFVPQCIRPARLAAMRMLHGAVAYGLALVIF